MQKILDEMNWVDRFVYIWQNSDVYDPQNKMNPFLSGMGCIASIMLNLSAVPINSMLKFKIFNFSLTYLNFFW